MVTGSPVYVPFAGPLGCAVVGAAVGCAAGLVPGFFVGLPVGCAVGLLVGCAVLDALGAVVGFACGIPPAIEVVLEKFGGVTVKIAPSPPIVPPAIKSALFICPPCDIRMLRRGIYLLVHQHLLQPCELIRPVVLDHKCKYLNPQT